MKHTRWNLGMWLLVLTVTSSTVGAEPAPSTPLKEQLVKLLASIKMTLNHAVDEKFCRQFLEDFKKQNKVEHVQPIIQAERIDDPALASFLGKCPTVKWIGADDDEPGYRLNTRYRDQFHNLSVGTAHFRLYEVDIDNDGENDREHVFYSDGFVPEPLAGEELPPVDELDKSLGEYTAVDLENCATLGGITVGMGSGSNVPVYNGVIRYQGDVYIYNLYGYGKYRLNIEKLAREQKNFTLVCRYWQ